MGAPLRRTVLLAAVVVLALMAGQPAGRRVFVRDVRPAMRHGVRVPRRSSSAQVESLTADTESLGASGDQTERPVWRVRMKVSDVFRGEIGEGVDVFTSTSSASCGYEFSRGGTYLVYAYRQPSTGRWGTGICSRTRPVDKAGEDLAYLRAMRRGDMLSTLRGKVQRQDPVQTEYGRSYQSRPYPGLRIDIELLGSPVVRKYQATTNEAGEYIGPGSGRAIPGDARTSSDPLRVWARDRGAQGRARLRFV
jgi:hypothetical protein